MGGRRVHPLLGVVREAYDPAPSLEAWVERMTRRAAALRLVPGGEAIWGAVARILDEKTGETLGDYFVQIDEPKVRRAFEDHRRKTQHRKDFLVGSLRLRSSRDRTASATEPYLQRMHAHFEAAGVHDMLHLTAFDGERHLVTLGLVLKRPLEKRWSARSEAMAGAHFAIALRLQARAFALSRALDGRVAAPQRFQGDLRSQLQEGIRELVASQENPASAARAIECWRGLLDRSWSLVDMHDHGQRRYVVAMPNVGSVSGDGGLSRREAQIAAFVAEGCSLKWIACTLGLAESTVTNHLRSALEKLGLAHAVALARGFRRYVSGRDGEGCRGLEQPEAPAMPFPARGFKALALTESAVVISFELVPTSERKPLLELLSPRERVVVDLAMAGLSDKAIAERLGRSRHTVSNQLRRAYARLGVNSRVELGAKLRALFEGDEANASGQASLSA